MDTAKTVGTTAVSTTVNGATYVGETATGVVTKFTLPLKVATKVLALISFLLSPLPEKFVLTCTVAAVAIFMSTTSLFLIQVFVTFLVLLTSTIDGFRILLPLVDVIGLLSAIPQEPGCPLIPHGKSQLRTWVVSNVIFGVLFYIGLCSGVQLIVVIFAVGRLIFPFAINRLIINLQPSSEIPIPVPTPSVPSIVSDNLAVPPINLNPSSVFPGVNESIPSEIKNPLPLPVETPGLETKPEIPSIPEVVAPENVLASISDTIQKEIPNVPLNDIPVENSKTLKEKPLSDIVGNAAQLPSNIPELEDVNNVACVNSLKTSLF